MNLRTSPDSSRRHPRPRRAPRPSYPLQVARRELRRPACRCGCTDRMRAIVPGLAAVCLYRELASESPQVGAGARLRQPLPTDVRGDEQPMGRAVGAIAPTDKPPVFLGQFSALTSPSRPYFQSRFSPPSTLFMRESSAPDPAPDLHPAKPATPIAHPFLAPHAQAHDRRPTSREPDESCLLSVESVFPQAGGYP